MTINARAIFISQLEQVGRDINLGHTLRTILENNTMLEGVSYARFCAYVREYFPKDKQGFSPSELLRDNACNADSQFPDDINGRDIDYVAHSIIVPRPFRRVFRIHAANADLSEYEFLRVLVEKYEAEL